MSVPDYSIIDIKPKITNMLTETRKGRFSMVTVLRICCICGSPSTKIAVYPIQGATRIERYCDSRAEKQFSRTI